MPDRTNCSRIACVKRVSSPGSAVLLTKIGTYTSRIPCGRAPPPAVKRYPHALVASNSAKAQRVGRMRQHGATGVERGKFKVQLVESRKFKVKRGDRKSGESKVDS